MEPRMDLEHRTLPKKQNCEWTYFHRKKIKYFSQPEASSNFAAMLSFTKLSIAINTVSRVLPLKYPTVKGFNCIVLAICHGATRPSCAGKMQNIWGL